MSQSARSPPFVRRVAGIWRDGYGKRFGGMCWVWTGDRLRERDCRLWLYGVAALRRIRAAAAAYIGAGVC